jgi:hypothetical protein
MVPPTRRSTDVARQFKRHEGSAKVSKLRKIPAGGRHGDSESAPSTRAQSFHVEPDRKPVEMPREFHGPQPSIAKPPAVC